ncbi:hypothetical protein VTJ04DRAFT_10328 [Mycothermus thermophilus]|uniref:uncharacterized protein n=1 Tax=Humicola insolens TaxID=85995 RepID=UPI0037444E73
MASTSTSPDGSASVADIRKTLRQLRNAIDGLESATGSPNFPKKNLQDLSRALASAVDAFEILTSGVWEAIGTQIIESKNGQAACLLIRLSGPDSESARSWSQASPQHPVKDRASSASLIGPKWDRHHHQLPRPPFPGPAVAGAVIAKLFQNPP